MGTYKVLQDIEAEDKLLGPLTLRQFIYAVITVVSCFIIFKIALVKWYLALPLIPHTILFGVLAAPFGHDQSSEVWLLARIRFALKPRIRIWDQAGMKELVSVSAPKVIEKSLTNNLSQTEVRSRLTALASTIDSRGWAIKNVNVNMFGQPSYVNTQISDRLVSPSMLPQDVPNFNVVAADDMLDARNNPTAQNFDRMIAAAEQARRQQAVRSVQAAPAPQPAAGQWFMNQPPAGLPQPGYTTFNTGPVIAPGATLPRPVVAPTAAELALADRIRADKANEYKAQGHMRTIMPLNDQGVAIETPYQEAQNTHQYLAYLEDKPAGQPLGGKSLPDPLLGSNSSGQNGQSTMTTTPDPAILNLANNDDLDVATIARQAQKAKPAPPDDEVVISLH